MGNSSKKSKPKKKKKKIRFRLKSREQFAKEAARTIRENHAKQDNESFIFGISGKWGEGKTTFLESLGKELKDDFEVVEVNPWKFAADKISFLRSFLKRLYTKISWHKRFWKYVLDRLVNRDKLSDLYFDKSKNKIHWLYFFITTVFIIIIFWLYYEFKLPEATRDFVHRWKIPLFIIGIPVLLSLISKIITIQRSSRAVSTLDRFDDLLRSMLKSFKNKNIIIFVDDLDRVTPRMARGVLDNLRTFFDKKELTFIVTGDHTVLERYLGEDLLPHSKEPEQLEEGRRFLKKIFNVYWRLPLPIDKELKEFLVKVFKENSDSLSKIFKKATDKEKFKEHFAKKEYFENNFRQILRFLETTIFTFNIIANQKDNAEVENKKYFEEMARNPLLVIRMLMMQELCAPLFEKIIEDSDILYELEHAADIQNTEKVNQILSRYEDQLSISQKIFIEKFLYEKPRFYENKVLSVSDIRPFLYLAADASFGDARGPSPEDFISMLEKDSPKEVKQVLIASGETKIKKASNEFVKKIQDLGDSAQKNKYIKTMLKSLVDIPDDHKAQSIFLEEIKSIDIDFYKDLSPQDRMETYLSFWQWLDKFKINLTADYKEKFNFVNHEDLNFLEDNKHLGNFASYVIIKWFLDYYNQDKGSALEKIKDILPRLKKKVAKERLADAAEGLSNEVITDPTDNLRERRFDILINYTEEGKNMLRKKVFKKIEELDENIWRFADSKAVAENAIWSKKELERKILDRLESIADINALLDVLRFGVDKIQLLLKGFRHIIFDKHLELFVDNLAHIINEQNFQYIAPGGKQGEKLFDRILEKVKSLDNNQKVQWLDYLDKSRWLWSSLESVDKRKFGGLKRAANENEQVKEAINRVSNSWS